MLTVRMVLGPSIGGAIYSNVLQERQQHYIVRYAQNVDMLHPEASASFIQTMQGMQYQGKSKQEALNMAALSTKGRIQVQATLSAVKEMAGWADIVVENFSPGVVDKLGIGYKDLKEVNPRIIYGSISGFGQTGPYRKKPAYDVVCQAMGGFMNLTGEKDGKPYKLGPSIVDASAGIHMAYALMVALYYRERNGVGQFIDIGMMDTAFSTLENFVVTKTLTGVAPSRNGNANLGSAPFNSYRTKDGYVTIAVANNSLFQKLTGAMGREDLLENPLYKENYQRKANEDQLNLEVEKWTIERTTHEICEILDKAGVPVGPILTIDDLIADPHLKEREMLVDIDHPILGSITYPGNPIKMSESSAVAFERAPLLGEHQEYVLKDILKKSNSEIQLLKEQNVV